MTQWNKVSHFKMQNTKWMRTSPTILIKIQSSKAIAIKSIHKYLLQLLLKHFHLNLQLNFYEPIVDQLFWFFFFLFTWQPLKFLVQIKPSILLSQGFHENMLYIRTHFHPLVKTSTTGYLLYYKRHHRSYWDLVFNAFTVPKPSERKQSLKTKKKTLTHT